ncbi:Lysine histidine transporter 1 [Armadillidium vulgare]|nr:Lysine histidine transporter 1 [Armadillidium vulgare]
MSVFPTIQNDMKDRTKFWKSVVIGFATILTLYFPIALFGYIYIGDAVSDNVILSFDSCPSISVAIAFEIFNLLGTFIITLSPVFQALEAIFGVPSEFGLKRVTIRTGLILCELFVALAFPDFGLIVNLIGGSAMCCLSFILPPIMYLRLIDDKTHEVCTEDYTFMAENIFVGSFCSRGDRWNLLNSIVPLRTFKTLNNSLKLLHCFHYFR